ncbi:MAG: hypothetical protein LKJ92_08085 [Ruminococcus sp.]|jgi:hypothetical protein|nr:hypothetical protein [Ruminococcus sp.]
MLPEEFLSVIGVGDNKLKQYGDRFISAIAEYKATGVENTDINVVTKSENNDIVSEILSAEENSNCEFIMYDNVFQSFAVIDKRIVWYGNINFLSYNYSEKSAMRFISESVAGKLSDKYN